jgi:hypothetical protein
VSASVTPAGAVTLAAASAPAAGSNGGSAAAAAPRVSLERPRDAGGRWVLAESEFGAGLVGGKSANLAALRSKLPTG